MLNLCKTKTGNMRLANNNEVSRGKGLIIMRRDAWSLEDQMVYAKRYNLCMRAFDSRICGRQLIRHTVTGKMRSRCGKCKVLPDTMDETTFALQKRKRSLVANKPKVAKPKSSDCGVQTPWGSECGVDTADTATQGDLLMETLDQVRLRTWDNTHAKRTRENKKSEVKKTLQLFGLTLQDQARDFLDIIRFSEPRTYERHETVLRGGKFTHVQTIVSPGWEAFFQTVWTNRNAKNRLSAIRLLALSLGQQEFYQCMVTLEQRHLEPTSKRISEERRAKIEHIATVVGVNMEARRPGKLLLEAIQHNVMTKLVAETPAQIAFWFDQAFGFCLPALRGQTLSLKWARRAPKPGDYKTRNLNAVVVQNGQVQGVYFGAMKMQNTKRFNKWKSRFYLDDKGIHTHDGRVFKPCHMRPGEFNQLMRQFKLHFQTLFDQKGNPQTGSYCFSRKLKLNEIAKDVWGVQFGAHLRRIIFRNGVTQVDPDFIEFVMQHSEVTDRLSYYKEELAEGPWRQ